MCNKCCKDNSKNEGNNISLNFEEQWIKVGNYSSKLIELKGRNKPDGIVNVDYSNITTFFNIKKEIFQRITANSKVVLLKRENKRYEKYIIFAVRTNNEKFYLGLCKNYSDTFNRSGNGLFEGPLGTVEIKMIYNKNDIEASAQMFKNNVNVIKIIFIKNFDTKDVNNMYAMFNRCVSLEELNLANLNTEKVTSMYAMFNECYSLTSLNLSNFNTENVIDMEGMFYMCSNLKKLNLSKFNTKYVNNMKCMFYGCSSLTSLNLSNFNTRNVTNMDSMFCWCSNLKKLYVDNFNTNNVKNKDKIFSEGVGDLIIYCRDENKVSSLQNYIDKNKSNSEYKNSNKNRKHKDTNDLNNNITETTQYNPTTQYTPNNQYG